MDYQKEFFKQLHPEQFSDSKIVKKGKLDRDFLDYFLANLSIKGLEKNFEHFCRKLIEIEVCPNLLPQTGPTGGGDSKVDSETYPVSEPLTEAWYHADAKSAGDERWAFAFSTKKDWKSKVKSDVKKIVETNNLGRNYKKIFFVSNQDIPDKKRAETEDQLRTEYKIDVRIFDKNWILERVFSARKNLELVCESFSSLSKELLNEIIVGELDYKREQQIEEIENKLKRLTELKPAEIIDSAKYSVILSRELEVDYQKILGLVGRYKQLASKYGTTIDKANTYLDCAWTLYWWYGDNEGFYDNYLLLEKIAQDEKTVHLLESLITLFPILYRLEQEDLSLNIHITEHKRVVDELYTEMTKDKNKPNRTMAAQAAYQCIRLLYGESIDDVVCTYIDILNNSKYSLEVDISKINEVIALIPNFQEAERFDELFELMLERISQEEKETVASQMLAQRGHSFIEKKPYKALSYFSRSLLGLYNETNAFFLMQVLFEMAVCFEKVGLYWAARNYYYYVLTYCVTQYMTKGEIFSLFYKSAHQLKWLELEQGRVVYSTEMSLLENIGISLYPENISMKDDSYVMFLAYPLFQSPYEKIVRLRKFPSYLEKRGLDWAAIVCRYELGIYDEGILACNNGSKDEYDKFMKELCNKPTDLQIRYSPWYGFEQHCELKSRVMGCEFIVHTNNKAFNIEFATSLLASIECLLGTGFPNGLNSLIGHFEIKLKSVEGNSFFIDFDYSKDNPLHMEIRICESGFTEILSTQKLYSKKVLQIISIIVAEMLRCNDDFNTLKQLIESDDVIIRTDLFAHSLFYGFTTFGSDAFSYEALTDGLDEEPLNRKCKIQMYAPATKAKENLAEKKIHFGIPPEFSERVISNDSIFTDDIINVSLWEQGKWKGVVYGFEPNKLPVLSLLFENKKGLDIFQEWIDKIGQFDEEDIIGIRIIEEIDKKHPYWYRVCIGSNLMSGIADGKNHVFISKIRLHTMNPANNINLSNFKLSLQKEIKFYLFPSLVVNGNVEFHFEKRILKNRKSLQVLKAYEINENDILSEIAIMPSDQPIIPSDKRGCDLEKILKRKRNIKMK